MADTASLVVALSAQLTKFEKDMKAAGIMADNAVTDIEKKFAGINPQVSASFLGNLFSNIVTKGIDAAVKALSDFVDGFVALKKAADLAEISLGKVYGLSSALGKNQEDNARSIEKLTIMLDDMRRGETTSFGNLKAANPDFFKGMGKDTFDVAENLARVAEMVKQAGSEVEKWKIAEQAGLTRDMVKELEKGGDVFRKMTADNQAMGAALAQGAAQADVLQKALSEAAQNALGLKTAMADFFKDSLMLLGGLLSGLQKFRELATNSWGGGGKGGGVADPVIKDLETLQNKLNSAGKEATTFKERLDAIGSGTKTADKSKTLAHPAARGGGGGGEGESFLERENRQIEKQIELLDAQAATVGKGIAAQQAARAEALLLAAAKRDELVITDQLRESIKAQADAYGQAALRNAEATAQIAKFNSASQQFGAAVSTAFADAIVDGKALNEVLESLVKTLAKAAINSTIMSLFTPGAGAGVSPLLSMLGIGGARMAGGPVGAGQSYLVGENGPEMFRPGQSGMVIPNSALGRGAGGAGTAIQNTFMVAGDVSPGTIARLQAAVVAANQKADGLTRAFASTQRLQASGVS